VSALDDSLAHLGSGSLVLALIVAVLLGLRHATDPDHLTAVAALIAGDGRAGSRKARRLGLSWGLGHATTLFAFGVPVVLAGRALPNRVTSLAELTIGLLIAALALRLLWRRHEHPQPQALGRSPLAAYGIGLVHGVGGSGGVGILLVGAISGGGAGVIALGLFAAATAGSMALVSTAFGLALARGTLTRHLVPAMGAASLAFGAWYALGAL
jgi:hypothetical protein